MRLIPINLIADVWILTGACWLVLAARSKSVAKRESILSRALHLALVGAAFFLLTYARGGVGLLGARFVADQEWTGWLGLALVIAGCALSIWARLYLGSNWSAMVTVKQNHELIRRGPYSFVRHPIYSGILLAFLGHSVAVGEVRALLALALAFAGIFVKLRREEQFMAEKFSAEYARYKREVKRLVPYIL